MRFKSKIKDEVENEIAKLIQEYIPSGNVVILPGDKPTMELRRWENNYSVIFIEKEKKFFQKNCIRQYGPVKHPISSILGNINDICKIIPFRILNLDTMGTPFTINWKEIINVQSKLPGLKAIRFNFSKRHNIKSVEEIEDEIERIYDYIRNLDGESKEYYFQYTSSKMEMTSPVIIYK